MRRYRIFIRKPKGTDKATEADIHPKVLSKLYELANAGCISNFRIALPHLQLRDADMLNYLGNRFLRIDILKDNAAVDPEPSAQQLRCCRKIDHLLMEIVDRAAKSKNKRSRT